MPTYFRAEGEALNSILHFNAMRRDCTQFRTDWVRKVLPGVEKIRLVTDNSDLIGLRFPKGTPLPPGWKQKKGQAYATPDYRTTAGRLLGEQMAALGVPTGRDLGVLLGLTGAPGLFFVGATGQNETVGLKAFDKGDTTVWVVEVPSGQPFGKSTPVAGLVPLKASEYWSLVEARDAERDALKVGAK